jgi:predicted lipoprotein with Yx(FWY)xxD motif
MRILFLITMIVSVLAIAAPSVTAAPSRETVTVHSSAYGRVLFDGRGFALYAFTKDGKGASTCNGACAAAWPPYIVSSHARASAGAKASLLGTVKREDGRLQETYAGRPLYYFVGDRKPLQILCQNVAEFGGTWLVVRASGTLVR